MRRRDLLRWSALSGVLPAWSPRANTAIPPAPAAGTARCLVLVELKGGNDGLNTLMPFTDPEYYRVRPRLAIAQDRVLALDDRTGLHPALRPLMPAREAGELAWVQGVGYAEPNRSHFRSMDIWERFGVRSRRWARPRRRFRRARWGVSSKRSLGCASPGWRSPSSRSGSAASIRTTIRRLATMGC